MSFQNNTHTFSRSVIKSRAVACFFSIVFTMSCAHGMDLSGQLSKEIEKNKQKHRAHDHGPEQVIAALNALAQTAERTFGPDDQQGLALAVRGLFGAGYHAFAGYNHYQVRLKNRSPEEGIDHLMYSVVGAVQVLNEFKQVAASFFGSDQQDQESDAISGLPEHDFFYKIAAPIARGLLGVLKVRLEIKGDIDTAIIMQHAQLLTSVIENIIAERGSVRRLYLWTTIAVVTVGSMVAQLGRESYAKCSKMCDLVDKTLKLNTKLSDLNERLICELEELKKNGNHRTYT